MKIHESGENYLETIYLLKKSMGEVRSIDVATKLEYTKASISRAMGLLKKASYIVIDAQGHIQLTKEGLTKAKAIYDRHLILTKFFMLTIALDEKAAEKEACKIEHVISNSTFSKIKHFVSENNPKD